jgi:CDP-diacylglycerol--glycerol-3-phosphate 3-phosphatidyltransferase
MPGDAPAAELGSRRSLPNLLTASRVVVAAAFFGVLTPWRYAASPAARGEGVDGWLLLAAALFVIAALTDALDGHLARKWNVVSVFGRVMDPFADKLLVIGGFAFLAGPGFWLPRVGAAAAVVSHVTPWVVVIVLGRELLVTSIRAVVESGGGSFAASWSGKAKMILQSVCIPLVLVLLALPRGGGAGALDAGEGWTGVVIRILVWTTTLVTAWSGVPYVVRAAAVLKGPAGTGAPRA